MKNPDFIDVGRIIDEIFDAAEDFTNAFKDSVNYGTEKFAGMRFGEKRDFYPAYSYPPANVYITEDKTMVFEFALAGFSEEDIALEFKGEYMFLTVEGAERLEPGEEVKYFKKRLKYKNINGQRYYVPEDKFDRERTRATYKNGILRVIIPPREEVSGQPGVKVKIEKDTSKAGGSSSGGAKEKEAGN